MCQQLAITLPTPQIFVAAATNHLAVLQEGAPSTLYDVPKAAPFLGTGTQLNGMMSSVAADDVFGAFAAGGGNVYNVGWGTTTATPLTIGNPYVVTTRLGVFGFGSHGSELCFLNAQPMGSGGGVYCQSELSSAQPALAFSLDSGAGLSGDGTNIYSVYKGQFASGNDYTWTLGATGATVIAGTFPDTAADIAVDGATTYWLAVQGGVIYTQPTAGGTPTSTQAALPNATRIKVVGSYIYLMAPTTIVRFTKTSLTPQTVANEPGHIITSFDVDAQGVYWGVANVGVKLLGLSSQ